VLPNRSTYAAENSFFVYKAVNDTMGLVILPPNLDDERIELEPNDNDGDYDSDASMSDDMDVGGRPAKRVRLSAASSRYIVVPGEMITDETQWMR